MLADWHISSQRERDNILGKKTDDLTATSLEWWEFDWGTILHVGHFFRLVNSPESFGFWSSKPAQCIFILHMCSWTQKFRCEQEHTVTTSITFIGYNLSYSIGLNILGLSLPCPIGSPKWLSWGTSVWAASHSGRRTNSEFWVPEMMNLFCSTRGLGIPRSELHWNG